MSFVRTRTCVVLVVLATAMVLIAASEVGATPATDDSAITVDTLSGEAADGDCSLAEAIKAANTDQAVDGCVAGDGDDTINITPAGTITAPSGGLRIESNVTVQGSTTVQGEVNGTTVRGGFEIVVTRTPSRGRDTANATAVKLADLTISGSGGAGVTVKDYSDNPFLRDRYDVTLENLLIEENAEQGIKFLQLSSSVRPGKVHVNHSIIEENRRGGIYMRACDKVARSWGNMLVFNSIIQRNSNPNGSGGVFNDCGFVHIRNSTISKNAGTKAAVHANQGELYRPHNKKLNTQTRIVNTTIEGNTIIGRGVGERPRSSWGGGVHISRERFGGFTPELWLQHATITRNQGSDATAGGVYIDLGVEYWVFNTVVSGNTEFSGTSWTESSGNQCDFGGRDYYRRGLGGNASADSHCGFANRRQVDLGMLKDNGGANPIGPNGALGRVETIAIDATSPLANAGLRGRCLGPDARGVVRPSSGSVPCDIGAYETISGDVTGTIWDDVDGDRVKDGDESVLSNVTVELQDAEGAKIGSGITNNGRFRISTALGGFRTVKVTDDRNALVTRVPTGPQSVRQRTGLDGATVPTYNFGYAEPVRVGDAVWEDTNGDGVKDTGEPGIGGVTLQVVDDEGTVEETVATNPDGTYTSGPLVPGEWTVRVTDDNDVLGQRQATTPASLRIQVSADSTLASNFDFGYRPTAGDHVINVNTLARPVREGRCSLAEAIEAANTDRVVDGCLGGAGQDTINISVPGVIHTRKSPSNREGGAYLNEYFRITSGMTIQGNSTIIDGTQEGRFYSDHGFGISLSSGTDAMEVTLADMAITGTGQSAVSIDGRASGSLGRKYAVTLENLRIQANMGAGVAFLRGFGAGNSESSVEIKETVIEGNARGGIYMKACETSADLINMQIIDSVIRGNSTGERSQRSAGVTNACGKLRVVRSTISMNTGVRAAVLALKGDWRNPSDRSSEKATTRTEIVNTTIVDNNGKGIAVFDLGGFGPVLSVDHATITRNGSEGEKHGGIYIDPAVPAAIRNTVVTGNMGVECRFGDGGIPLTINEGNASPSAECGFDHTEIGSTLEALKDNGGTTRIGPEGTLGHVPTVAVNVASSLVNGGHADLCEEVDARGVARPQGSGCDIGAFELELAEFGGHVWVDSDADGVKDQDETENRQGVMVRLSKLDSDGAPVPGWETTTRTDEDGDYSFADLEAGSYRVRFESPDGHRFTVRQPGGDSDVDPSSGETEQIVLSPGANESPSDAGVYQPVSITGEVWEDGNADGTKAGDPGLADATVSLLKSGRPHRSGVATDDTGVHTFDDLAPGSYQVEFTLPDGYRFTVRKPGGDSDVDPSSGRTAATAAIILASGDGSASVGAGAYQPVSITGEVWEDGNADGTKAGDPGLADATVSLLKSGRPHRSGVATDDTGVHTFDDLAPGSYQVEFTLPDGYRFTVRKPGGDSDVDPSSGRTAATAAIILASGDGSASVGAGAYQPAPTPPTLPTPPPEQPEPSVAFDKSARAEGPVKAGGRVSYSFVVTNTGNVTLTGLSVSDPKTGKVTCPETTLAPGENTTCTAVYTATPADIDAGVIVNKATLTAKAPDGETVTAFDSVWFDVGSGTVTAGRLWGPDRYATAAVISRETFASGVGTVYVATGVDFPDALAGSAASGGDGPILLVTRDSIPGATIDELKRLKPRRIVVLGGTGVVSAAVEVALKAYGSVSRQAGPDRYSTAAAISAKHFDPGPATAYVATGADFPDALTGGPAAAKLGGPILLTQKDKLPAATVAELKRLKPKHIVVLGGTGVVSAAVEKALQAHTSGKATRLAGADRHSTGAAISKAVFKPGVAVVYVATGANFPDALAGGAAGAFRDGPVLLVSGSTIPKATKDELSRLKPKRIIVLGGTAAVPETVLDSLNAYLPKP